MTNRIRKRSASTSTPSLRVIAPDSLSGDDSILLDVTGPGRYRLTRLANVPDRPAYDDEVPPGARRWPGVGWLVVERIGDIPAGD